MTDYQDLYNTLAGILQKLGIDIKYSIWQYKLFQQGINNQDHKTSYLTNISSFLTGKEMLFPNSEEPYLNGLADRYYGPEENLDWHGMFCTMALLFITNFRT